MSEQRLDPEVFDAMMTMLRDVHSYWRPMAAVTKEAMVGQLNKFGVTSDIFGDYCLKVMGEPDLQPADIVGYFRGLYLESSRQKALPEPKVSQDNQSDEYIRFVRMMRELQGALACKQRYPPAQQATPTGGSTYQIGLTQPGFKQHWQRPLTDDDRLHAKDRANQIKMQFMGVEIPMGGPAPSGGAYG